MENPMTADFREWLCTRGSDFPDGYLLWLPALFLIVDDGPDPAMAMVWAIAVLLAAAAFWAAGRGRAESWAEALFAFGWMGGWSLASGWLLLDVYRAGSEAWLWAAAGLAVGAAALAGAWSYRRRLERVPSPPRAAATAAKDRAIRISSDVVIWFLVSAVLFLLLGRGALRGAAAGIIVLAFLSHLLLTPRGRAATSPEAER